MEETLKYIEVLNWGYGGFAPMTISQDFEHSYKQVAERLQLLDGLNWGRLLNEAKDKSSLQKHISIDTDFDHQLHFMRDRQMLLDAIPTMFKAFHNEADKLCNNGNWTNEQWQEYRGTLGAIESIFAKRLKEFATAYSDIIGDEQAEPQQKDLHYYCIKAINKGYLRKVDGGYRRVTWSKAQLAYFLGHFPKPDGTFNDKGYCQMFGESRLSKAWGQLINNKTGNGKPMGYEVVDALLQE